jgi:hypothetical protein
MAEAATLTRMASQATQAVSRMSSSAMKAARANWRPLVIATTAAGFAFGLIPGIGALFTHFMDRIKNGSDKGNEHDLRAQFYKNQIAATLRIDPAKVNARAFAKAAEINPALAKLYREPESKESNENRSSAMASAGAGIASAVIPIPGAGILAKGAVSVGGSVVGGTLSSILSGDKVVIQDLVESLDDTLERTSAAGGDLKQVITPQMVFMMRVLQNDGLAETIRNQYGKVVNQMTPQELSVVMDSPAYTALAQRAAVEASSVAAGNMSVRDLAATVPNLKAGFASNVARAGSGPSHVDALQAQRMAAANDNGVTKRA